MKKFITAACCAFVGWLVGIQFTGWLGIIGVVVGFLSGLLFENWQETKATFAEIWQKYRGKERNFYSEVFLLIIMFGLLASSWIIPGVYFDAKAKNFDSDLPALLKTIGALTAFVEFIIMFSWLGDGKLEATNQRKKTIRGVCRCLILFNPIVLLPYLVFLLVRFWRIVTGTILELAREERKLTFAICVAMGSGIGLICGKALVCGLIAAGVGVGLLYSAEKLKDWDPSAATNTTF